ncbi:Succinate-semialdehyde dehydrogenase [NADP(+)] 1 [compost metagenome]
MIAFTGSVPTGQKIMQGATERMKPLLLELGSSDPFIVMDDADFDMAVKAATFSAFLNSGQVCTGSERFFIHEKIYDDFMDALVKSVRTLRIGDPMGDVDIGPLINKAAVNGVETGLAHLQSLGATIRHGGQRGDFARGHFFQPTIVEITDPLKQQPRHELFGPQATFCRIRSLDEAIAHANNSDFGLGSCIFTSSFESAMRAATEIDAGHVWINDPLKDNVAAPFGGKKMSGLGRELGLDGINAFTDVKHIHMQFKAEAQGWWFPYTRPDI